MGIRRETGFTWASVVLYWRTIVGGEGNGRGGYHLREDDLTDRMSRRQRTLILCENKKGVHLATVAISAILPKGKAGSSPAMTSTTPDSNIPQDAQEVKDEKKNSGLLAGWKENKGGVAGVNPNHAYTPDLPGISSQAGASNIIVQLDSHAVNPFEVSKVVDEKAQSVFPKRFSHDGILTKKIRESALSASVLTDESARPGALHESIPSILRNAVAVISRDKTGPGRQWLENSAPTNPGQPQVTTAQFAPLGVKSKLSPVYTPERNKIIPHPKFLVKRTKMKKMSWIQSGGLKLPSEGIKTRQGRAGASGETGESKSPSPAHDSPPISVPTWVRGQKNVRLDAPQSRIERVTDFHRNTPQADKT